MTVEFPVNTREPDDLLWRFERSDIVWETEELCAVNLLFQLALDPRLSAAQFGAAFLYHGAGYCDPAGHLHADDAAILTEALKPWRDQIAQLEGAIETAQKKAPASPMPPRRRTRDE